MNSRTATRARLVQSSNENTNMNSHFLDLVLQPTIIIAVLGIIAGTVRYLVVKHQERTSANRALLSDISRLLRLIDSHARLWEGMKQNGNTDLPLIPFSADLTDTLLKNWAEIDPSYVGYATRFYSYIKFLNGLQLTRADHDKLNKHNIFVDTYAN